MVTSCSVKYCKSKSGQGIKFHRLPKGEIREAWITFLKKFNPLFMPTRSSTNVCGLHFLYDLDYEITPTSINQTKRLKKNAVPSILNQNIGRLLFHKLYRDAEEFVTLSWSDLYAELPSVPPAIPLSVNMFCSKNIVMPKHTIQNASTVSPAPVVQNRNEISPASSTLVKTTVKKNY